MAQPEISENPMHFDDDASNMQEQKLPVKNMTSSQAMILHCTHPPSTHSEFQGLPTNDVRTQVVTTWRNNEILKKPAQFDGQTLTDDAWSAITDYGFIIPNGARVKYIGCYYRKPSQANPSFYTQDVANTSVQDVFDFSIWWKTVNLYRPVAKSTTLYANVTAFNNIGSLNCQQFNPAILFAGTLSEFSWRFPREFVHFIRCGYERGDYVATKEEIHSDFNYHPFEHFFREQNIKPSGLSIDPSTTIQVINIGQVGFESDTSSLMPTPSQMLSNSARAYAGKFQDGCFAVQRLNTLAPSWFAGTRSDKTPKTQWFGLYECYHYSLTPDSAPSFVPFKEDLGGEIVNLRDTLWSPDMTWSFIRCQGLAANTIGGSQLSNAAPFLIKQYYTMECQPVWNGPWNGLSRTSPEPDAKALQALMDTFFKMPDGMPSKYNFLGTILPFLKSALPVALPFISKLFKSEKRDEKEVVREADSSSDSVAKLTKLVERMLRRGNVDTERLSTPSAPRIAPKKRPLALPSPVHHRRVASGKAARAAQPKAVRSSNKQ